MAVELLDLDNLVACLAGGQHLAGLDVVDVEGFVNGLAVHGVGVTRDCQAAEVTRDRCAHRGRREHAGTEAASWLLNWCRLFELAFE